MTQDEDAMSALVRTPQFSRNVPPTPDPLVRRDHLLDAIAQVATAESPVVFLEGEEGSGTSTLLAQFAEMHADNTFSLFIRPASRFAYSPDYLRLVLAEQYWWQLTGTRLDKQFVDIAEFSTLQLRVRRAARQRPIYITVDGLHQIPAEDINGVKTIFTDVLPIGVDGFRFVIAGAESLLERYLSSVRSKSYRLARFSDSESELILANLSIDAESRIQLLKLCRGNPGRLSSVRRLVASGVSAESILRSAPDKYLKFIGLEFEPIAALTETQKLLLAVLAFGRHFVTRNEQLAIVKGASQSDLETVEKHCIFLTPSEDGSDGLTFLSEAHRKFAEVELQPYKQQAVSLQIDHLIKNPNSVNAIRLLPTYYQALNQLQAIVDLISKDHYHQLLEVTQSVSALRARAAIGARSALELQQAGYVLQFALQRSIFSAIASPEQLQSEVGALVALGKPRRAIDIAAKTPTKERRLALLAEFARQTKERGLQVDGQIVSYIRELADEIDFSELAESAIHLAENIMFVDADLALKIVDIALKAETSATKRDQVFAKLSIAATISKDPDKTDLDKKVNARIGDETLQKLVQAVRTIVADFSFDEILRMVEGMEIRRQIYFLTILISANTSRANVLDVVDYTLDQLIKNTSYSPKARDLANLARPLATAAGDEDRIKGLIRRLEAQVGLLELGAPTRDLVLLQMRLAHAELSFDESQARRRIEEVYYEVASIINVEIQALCFAVMSTALEGMDKSGSLESSTGFRAIVLADLKQAVSKLLADTADHFQVAAPTLVALAISAPEEAIEFVKKLNTEDRRNRAYRRIAEALVSRAWSEPRAKQLQTCISMIVSPTVFDECILTVLELCNRSEYSTEWLPDAEKIALRLRFPNSICHAEISLVRLCSKLKLFEKIDSRIIRFEENVSRVDSLYERIDRCFAMSAAVAEYSPEKAGELYERGDSERVGASIPNQSGSEVLQTCLFLLLRSFRPLIRSGDLPEGHLERFARICQQIPCSSTKAAIFSELACKAWCEDRSDLCHRIVNDWCRPLLDAALASSPSFHSYLCSELFPAMYCAHPASAFVLFDEARSSDHSSMVFQTAMMVLRRASPSEPWSSLDDEVVKVSHESLLDVVELLKRAPTDSCFYSIINFMIKSTIHKSNRTRVSSQQRADIFNRLESLISQKLPDQKNIQHDGFKVISMAQALRLIDAKPAQWEQLVEQARAIPNVADRSYVLLEVGEALPNRMSEIRKNLLNEARELARTIPAAVDRYSRLEAYIRAARKLDPPGAKSALREAMALTFETSRPEQAAEHRRNLVDIAETFGEGVLDELAEMIDDDPARAEAKADLERSVEAHKLKKKLSSLDEKVDREALTSSSLPSAAWKNVQALQCDKLVTHKPDLLSVYVDAAGGFSMEDAYPVLAWYIENAARRFTSNDDVRTFMVPLSEVLLACTEIAAATISEAPMRSLQIGAEEAGAEASNVELVVRPGQRSAAMDYLGRWLRDFGTGTILLCDPYFAQSDVEFLRLVLANAPHAPVRILTSKKAVSDGSREFDADSFLAEWKDLVNQDPPQTEVIAVALNEGITGPVHDRWLLSDQSGIRLGTSFNSIGMDKLSAISSLSISELATIRAELNQYLSRQRIVNGVRVTYQVVSF